MYAYSNAYKKRGSYGGLPPATRRKITGAARKVSGNKLARAAAGVALAAGGLAAGAKTAAKWAVKKLRGSSTPEIGKTAGVRYSGGRTKIRTKNAKLYKTLYPKGVSKPFFKKVNKVINHRDAYGKYIYCGSNQLRQHDLERPYCTYTDLKGIGITLNAALATADAAAVLFNGKAMDKIWYNQTGNFDGDVPMHLVSTDIQFYFRSTSGHVVNVEIWECTFKKHSQKSAIELAGVSFNDYRLKEASDYFGERDLGIESKNVYPGMLPTLLEFCHVKVHKIKFNPGEYVTKRFKGFKNRPVDLDTMKDEIGGGIYLYTKGTKNFFFRTINDMTVSGTTGYPLRWPSNLQGGIAMSYVRSIVITQPANIGTSALTGNVIKVYQDDVNPAASTDQQVSFVNPVSYTGTN